MRFRLGVAVNAFVLATSLSAAAATAATTSPSFRVETGDLEVGPVTAGTTAVATFVFHNDGEGDVRILRAAPS